MVQVRIGVEGAILFTQTLFSNGHASGFRFDHFFLPRLPFLHRPVALGGVRHIRTDLWAAKYFLCPPYDGGCCVPAYAEQK